MASTSILPGQDWCIDCLQTHSCFSSLCAATFYASLCHSLRYTPLPLQLYSSFIPKVAPDGVVPESLLLTSPGDNTPSDVTLAIGGAGGSFRYHQPHTNVPQEASPWELSLPQLHDMICSLEEYQLSRWRLLKVALSNSGICFVA